MANTDPILTSEGAEGRGFWNKGSLQVDGDFVLPQSENDFTNPDLRQEGRLKYNPTDNIPEYYNGNEWIQLSGLPYINRIDIINTSASNKRNDQSSTVRLDDGRLVVAYSHFGPGSEDLDESAVFCQFSNDNGLTWGTPQELIEPIMLGSYIPSLYKKTNGNILVVFFVREASTPVFLSSLRQIEYSPDMSTIVTPEVTILAATGYNPIGSDRLFYHSTSNRLLMPYPRLVSGLGASTNSVYESKFLVSSNEGETWTDSGLTINGFLNLDGFGGSMEPGFFQNKDKITLYSRNVVGNINACDLTWTGSAYTKGTEYKLNIGAMNAMSTIKYFPLLRCWIAAYTRLYDTPVSTRAQIDISISRDAANWNKVFTVDDILQVGGFMVNEPNIFIDDKVYINYSKDSTNGTYDLKSVLLPMDFFAGIDNKNKEVYTANPTSTEAIEIAKSRFLLNPGFDANTFNHIVRSFVDIKGNVEVSSPSNRSLHSFILSQNITNTDATIKDLNLGTISALSPQQVIDKVHVKGFLTKINFSGWSENSLKGNSIIDDYAVLTFQDILPASVTTGSITNKYVIKQLGATDINYFNGLIGLGTLTPSEKLHLVGNQKIESGNISIIGTNFDSTLASDSFSVKNKIVTAINWARVVSQITNASSVPYFAVGGYGLNQTFLYGYIGLGATPHNGAILKYTSVGVGIGLPGTDVPTEKLDVVGNGKFTGTVKVATAPVDPTDVVRKTDLDSANRSIINDSLVAVQTTANLDALYPSVPLPYYVIAKNTTGNPMIYIKHSPGVWLFQPLGFTS